MKRAKHIKMTERQFRKRKRREFHTLRKAMAKMRLGSAFLPHSASKELYQAHVAIEKMYEDCKQWWRKA